MNGPQHYKEAERLIEHAKRHTDSGDPRDELIAVRAAGQAQVHATLALVAAQISTADQGADQMAWPGQEWVDAALVRSA